MDSDRETIQKLIADGGDSVLLVGRTDEGHITQLESSLGVRLPESYRWFLREYGHGGIHGVSILGIGLNGSLAAAKETIRRRALGLPNHYVVVENCDEFQYCLDPSAGDDNDCPVILWDGRARPESPSFYAWLIESILSARDA